MKKEVEIIVPVSICQDNPTVEKVSESIIEQYSNSTGEPGMATMGYYITYLVYKISLAGGSELPYGYPAALGLTITMVTVPIALVGKWLLEKVTEPVEY